VWTFNGIARKKPDFGTSDPLAARSPQLDRDAGRLSKIGRKSHDCQDLNRIAFMHVRVTIALMSLFAVVQLTAQPAILAPYSPTPMDVVQRMLTFGKVGPRDVVYDLGCGDGRIVIEAARVFGARGVGIDIDPVLVARAQANAKEAGIESLVTFRVQDAMTVDVSDATVVTLYLLAASNVKLRPILTKTLRPGARIVAHNYPIGDWEPDVVDTFTDAAGTARTLFLWTIR
jgi:SAM-dependent methyltransferase